MTSTSFTSSDTAVQFIELLTEKITNAISEFPETTPLDKANLAFEIADNVLKYGTTQLKDFTIKTETTTEKTDTTWNG